MLPLDDRITETVADGVTTTFAWDFPVESASDIRVYSYSDYTETELTTGFSKVPDGGNYPTDSGTVVFITPPEAGIVIRIKGFTEISQPSVIPTNATIFSSGIESKIDRAFKVLQELNRELGRAITSDAGGFKIPHPSSGEGYLYSDGSAYGLVTLANLGLLVLSGHLQGRVAVAGSSNTLAFYNDFFWDYLTKTLRLRSTGGAGDRVLELLDNLGGVIGTVRADGTISESHNLATKAYVDSVATSGVSYGQGLHFVTATGAGAFTVPAGVKRIVITASAGGGGGGGGAGAWENSGNAGSGSGGGGGGAGGAMVDCVFDVNPGDTVSYNIGAGGAGGSGSAAGGSSSSNASSGSNGGNTTVSVTGYSTITLLGGFGGNGANGGSGGNISVRGTGGGPRDWLFGVAPSLVTVSNISGGGDGTNGQGDTIGLGDSGWDHLFGIGGIGGKSPLAVGIYRTGDSALGAGGNGGNGGFYNRVSNTSNSVGSGGNGSKGGNGFIKITYLEAL